MHLDDMPASDDPTAYFAHRPASITSLPITVFPIPGEAELSEDLHVTPRVFVAHAEWGRRCYQLASVTRELTTRPRMIEIYEGGASASTTADGKASQVAASWWSSPTPTCRR